MTTLVKSSLLLFTIYVSLLCPGGNFYGADGVVATIIQAASLTLIRQGFFGQNQPELVSMFTLSVSIFPHNCFFLFFH